MIGLQLLTKIFDVSKMERRVFFYFWAQNYRATELHIHLLMEVLLKALIKKQNQPHTVGIYNYTIHLGPNSNIKC